MPLTQPYQSRETAMRGDIVRLFCMFSRDGVLRDPVAQPQVKIVTNAYLTESGSSSSASSEGSDSSSTELPNTGYGPFYAVRMHTGIWYVDWYVPEDAAVGPWFDMWYYQFESGDSLEKRTQRFQVNPGDGDRKSVV